MSKSNIIGLSLVATFCLLRLEFTSATPEVYQESLNYPDRRVIFSPYYFTSKVLVYALCDKSFQAYENHCTVIRRDNVLQNDTSSCNITLKAEQEDGHLGPKYEVLPFGANKAIFISAEIGEDTFLKLSTIQLDTCKVTETKFHVDFPYEMALYHVVPYGDSFRVIFENKAQCGDKMCEMSIDSNGRKFGDLSSIAKSTKPLPFPIAAAIGSDLFFIKSGPKNSRDFVLQKSNGSEESISEQSFKPRTTVMSTANNILIAVCHDSLAAKTNIVCTQHYSNGQLRFKFTSTLVYEQLKIVTMRNLPNGEILLVVDCTEGILVIKIDAQGDVVGQFNIDDFECSKAFATAASFFESDKQGYCVTMACRQGNDFYIGDQSYLNLQTYCFTNADFSNN